MTHFDDLLLSEIRNHDEVELAAGVALEQIKSAESEAEIKLPPSYVEFLTHFNGGELSYLQILGVDRDDHLDLLTSYRQFAERIPAVAAKNMFPFARDFGGGCSCFDLCNPGENGELYIFSWNHEYSEEPADAPYLWSDKGQTFVEYLRSVIA